jgi:hypothetical protein
LIIQAHSDGIENQLIKDYKPKTDEEATLDQAQSYYFFSVLNSVFLTDKGKTIVRKYQSTFNARQAYAEMVEHMTKSTKAQHKKQELMNFLVTSKFGENVARTTATHFVLMYQEKFRQLDELSTLDERIPDAARMAMLQNAVDPVDELRKVKITAETNAVVTGVHLTYQQYCTLLESTAATYDKAHSSTANNKKTRTINAHENFDTDDPEEEETTYDEFDTQEGTLYGGIDLTPQDLWSINNSTVKPRSKFGHPNKLGSNKRNPPKFNGSNYNPSRFSGSNNSYRTPFIPPEIWHKLDPKARELLTSYNPTKGSKPTGRSVNTHELEYPDYYEDVVTEEESIPSATDNENPIMDFVTSSSVAEDGADIRNVLSAYKSRMQQKKKQAKPAVAQIQETALASNPTTYPRQCNVGITYTILQTCPHFWLFN